MTAAAAPAPFPAGMPAPAGAAEALAMRRALDSYLAATDPTTLTTAEQADALIEMEQCNAIAAAYQAWFLSAFISAQGPAADADASGRTWLLHKTGVTPGCAAGRIGWSRRVQAHPTVAAALGEGGRVSESMGKVICDYTNKLPAADRDAADIILLGVARAGARQDDIARLAAQMYEKSRSGTPDEDPGDGGPADPDSAADPDGSGAPRGSDVPGGSDGDPDGTGGGSRGSDGDPDGGPDADPDGADDSPGGPGGYGDDPDDSFDDRSVRLDTTLGGAGVLYGDLAPDCAALVKTVLDALSAPAGTEDTRSKAQRWHDALAEAMRRLLTAGLLPDRAGPAIRALVHIAFAELRLIRGASKLEAAWVARAQQDWAGHRAAASVAGSDGGAWLNGAAARGAYCDSMAVPVVTGTVNPAVLDRLVGLCLELAGHGRCRPEAPQPGSPAGLTEHARAMLQRAIIGAAVDLVSGPGGLASVLRTGLLGARLAGPPAGCRRRRHRPGRGPASHPEPVRRPLRVGRRMPTAGVGVPHSPRHPQGRRRQDQCQRLPAPVQFSPSRCSAPVGVEADPQCGRHDHRLQPGRQQDPAQPRAAAPTRVTTPAG